MERVDMSRGTAVARVDVQLACQAFLIAALRFSAWYLLRETVGGCSFGRGALYHLLRNRIYR
jgi:hypothetical protein